MSKKLVTDLTTMQIKSRFTKDLWYIYLGMLGLEEKDTVQHKAYAFVKWVIQKNAKVCLAFLVSPIVYLKLKKLLMESYNCYKDNSESKFTNSSFEVFFNEHFTICELLLGNCIPYERFNLKVTDYNDVVEAKMEFDLIVTNPPYAGKGKPLFMEITKTLYKNCLTNDGKLVSINPTSVVDNTYNGEDKHSEQLLDDYGHLMVDEFYYDDKLRTVFGNASIGTGIGIFTYCKNATNNLFSDFVREKRFGEKNWKMRKNIIAKTLIDMFGNPTSRIASMLGFIGFINSNTKRRLNDINKKQMELGSEKYITVMAFNRGNLDTCGSHKWDWVTLQSEEYLTIQSKLPDIQHFAVPCSAKKDAVNLLKWLNTDFIGFIVGHYKTQMSNSNVLYRLLPQPPKTNGDFSDNVIRETFGLTQDEMDWIHQEMKNFGWKVNLGKTESQLMDYIDEINK